MLTIRYFAGARAAAGVATEQLAADSLDELVTMLTARHGTRLASVLAAVLLSETTSNTAAANMIVPVVISIAKAANLDPLEPALGATMAASLGFMLPVSTPQNAVVYGSGTVPITTMIRTGASFDVIGATLIVIFLPVMASMVGLV